MTWTDHKIVTFSLVYFATGDIPLAAFSTMGSTLPDAIEGKPGYDPTTRRYRHWRRHHRKLSHWFAAYLAAIAAATAYCLNTASLQYVGHSFQLISSFMVGDVPWNKPASLALLFFFIGAALHLVPEDYVTGGVPILSMHRRHGIKLFNVHSIAEHVTTMLILALALWGRWAITGKIIPFS
jgi:hypothetical protein